MSMVIIGNSDIVWGVQPPLPLKGFPSGRVRIRQRNTDFVQAFVKTETGVRHFYVAKKDNFWIPKFEQASNNREVIP